MENTEQHSSQEFHSPPEASGEEYVKIDFDLVRDADGYPPYSSEAMWAVRLNRDRFRVDNIPFFVFGVSRFDIISAQKQKSGRLKFDHLVEAGGHSTLRIIFNDAPSDPRSLQERVKELCGKFQDLACPSEICHVPGMITIDVPPQASLARVRAILADGQKKKLWWYEEGTLAYPA